MSVSRKEKRSCQEVHSGLTYYLLSPTLLFLTDVSKHRGGKITCLCRSFAALLLFSPGTNHHQQQQHQQQQPVIQPLKTNFHSNNNSHAHPGSPAVETGHCRNIAIIQKYNPPSNPADDRMVPKCCCTINSTAYNNNHQSTNNSPAIPTLVKRKTANGLGRKLLRYKVSKNSIPIACSGNILRKSERNNYQLEKFYEQLKNCLHCIM